MLPYNRHLKQHSRELRNRMTDAEIRLWSKLRMKQINSFQFYRQKPIGNYIVDFFCPRAKLVIEVDGSQHYSEAIAEADRRRDAYMEGLGLTTLRYTDTEVLTNIEGVIGSILENMKVTE